MLSNIYSPTWFRTFLEGYSPSQTRVEIDFLARNLPLPTFRDVLDICCGTGRHSVPLAQRGYKVTGLDFSPRALSIAADRADGAVTLVEGDMRDLSCVPGDFDAALIMWQSFGYFDADTNIDILGQVRDKLRQGGRFVLDIYNLDFFAQHQGERVVQAGGHTITENRQVYRDAGGVRLRVTLDYGQGIPADTFDWQLFAPGDIQSIAEQIGFRALVLCTGFDEAQEVTDESPRMQLVLDRP